jgi:hypothetical protein
MGATRATVVLAACVAAVATAVLLPGASAKTSPDAATAAQPKVPVALQVSAVGPTQRVHGSDGREHVVYDLQITNSFTTEVTLDSLAVWGGGKKRLTLRGDALAAAIRPLGSDTPTRTLPRSSSVVAYIDVVLPRSAGRNVPKRVHNRIAYSFAEGAPAEALIGSRKVKGPNLRVDRRAPIVIAPPLRGSGWASGNGCCGDASVNHRSTILSASGGLVSPETFSVDYIRVKEGRFFSGDGTGNADWFGYGAPVRSVAAGRVVRIVDNRPEVPPFTATADNPTVTRPSQFGGNGVVVKIRPGVFAHYYHFQPGSARVRVGQQVRTGQRLGLFGNSGNTTGPHLHFGINSGADPLTSESLPFEIDRFRFEGDAVAGAAPGELTLTGKPRNERRSHPLVTSVSDYSR